MAKVRFDDNNFIAIFPRENSNENRAIEVVAKDVEEVKNKICFRYGVKKENIHVARVPSIVACLD